MDLRQQLFLPAWDSLTETEAEAVALEVERRVSGARFVGLEEHAMADQRRHVAVFEVGGVEMVLVPGALRELGFRTEMLEESAGEAWRASFQEEGHLPQQVVGGPDVGRAPPEDMLHYMKQSLSPRRHVSIAPLLVERALSEQEIDSKSDTDPHVARAQQVVAGGFRLLTADEWEHACSGGTDAMFRWGSAWPVDTDVYEGGRFKDHEKPNAFGLSYRTSPYQGEMVDDPEEIHHGDGGQLVCGESGPIAWITFSPWYRYRLRVADDRETWFEDTQPRRARSIFPRPGETVVRMYRPPTIFDSAQVAREQLREAIGKAPGLVVDEDEQEWLRNEFPELERVLETHSDNAEVLHLGATIQRKLALFDAALTTAQRAVAINPGWSELAVLASVHRVRGEVDAAIAKYEEAARADPTDGAVLADAADTLLACERLDEAADCLERALAREPQFGYARAMLPYVRFRASGDRRHMEELRAYARAEGKDDELAHELLREIDPRTSKKKKKAKPKKKARAKPKPKKKKGQSKKAKPTKKKAKSTKKARSKKR